MVAINFAGKDTAETTPAITVASGQVVRARFTEFVGSKLQMKIVSGGNTSYVTVDDRECWISPALPGDVVTLVYDGQGNPNAKVTGFLEAVAV